MRTNDSPVTLRCVSLQSPRQSSHAAIPVHAISSCATRPVWPACSLRFAQSPGCRIGTPTKGSVRREFERFLRFGDTFGQIEDEVAFAYSLREVDQFADEFLGHGGFQFSVFGSIQITVFVCLVARLLSMRVFSVMANLCGVSQSSSRRPGMFWKSVVLCVTSVRL